MGTILDYYGIRLNQTKQNRLSGCCPLHNGDNPNAFHVDLQRNLFHCFTHCGGGSIFDFVMKKENLSFYQAALKIWNIFFQPSQKCQNQTKKPKIPQLAQLAQLAQLKLQYNHPYLKRRGIDENVARYFHIGYCQYGIMKNRIAIPILNTNKDIVAFCGRAIDHTTPKYLFPKNFHKSKYLFNIQNIIPYAPKPVFIVEGFFDCIYIAKLGFDSIALMGASISKEQLNLLKPIKRFYILMLDGDDTGREAMPKVHKYMLMENLKVKAVYLGENMEPEQMDDDHLALIASE